MTSSIQTESFNLRPGRVLAAKYEVLSCLGAGWEGEVYRVREVSTGIDRAIKIFFPHRDVKGKLLKWYAKKLHKLRTCPMIIQYQAQDAFVFKKTLIPFLVSEFVEGSLLSDFLKTKPGKRMTPYEGLHLLYSLASGIESIHHMKEYHGDLHAENIIICRQGIHFDCKLLDLYHWENPQRENIQDDVCDLIRIFHESIGGAKHYRKQPHFVKEICSGLKRSLILKKFKTAGQLRSYLEHIEL